MPFVTQSPVATEPDEPRDPVMVVPVAEPIRITIFDSPGAFQVSVTIPRPAVHTAAEAVNVAVLPPPAVTVMVVELVTDTPAELVAVKV